MTPKNYAEVFKRIGQAVPLWNAVYLIISKLMDRGEEKLLQQACVNAGVNTLVDGIVGPMTIRAISMCDPSRLLSEIGALLVENKETNEYAVENDNLKDVIMKYLATAEGLHLHWNSNEKGFTTMYGVYAYSFPRAEPVRLANAYAVENGFRNITKSNVHKVDASLTLEQRRALKDAIFRFYTRNFMNEEVNEYLGNKSALSFFSNSVNGGMGRGYKSLQSALRVSADGKFGKGSFRALKSFDGSDDQLNAGILGYMYNFYVRLAKKLKFKRYFKGWVNRLVGLGFKRR